MIVGGIVRRLVTPARPGDPTLDDPRSVVQFRVEYLATKFDPAVWTLERDDAFFFHLYESAVTRAKALGAYAIVTAPPDQEAISEELRPLPEPQVLPPPIASPRQSKPKKNSGKRDRMAALRASDERVSEDRDWVRKTYG